MSRPEGDTSPKLEKLFAGKDAAVQKAERITKAAAPVLAAIHADPALTVPQQMEQAERMLGIYRSHAEKLADQRNRQQKHQEQLAALQVAFDEKSC